MTFLHPILLGIGAACVAIPIVIHLLMRRRRKPVRWAAMRFLLEAAKQRQRRVRLEQLLLLAARCLLLALIALAVARPMLGSAEGLGSGSRDVYLLLDTSLASAARGAEGATDLEGLIERALDLLTQVNTMRGDRAALITLGGPAEAVVMPPTRDLALLERRLRSLQPTDSSMDLAGGFALISPGEPDSEAPQPLVAVFSAFREGSLGSAPRLGVLSADALIRAEPPAGEPLANIGITAAGLLRPVVVTGGGNELAVGAAQVRVGLIRSGVGSDQAALSRVRMFAEREGSSREVGSAMARWNPGQTESQCTIDIDMAGLGGTRRLVLRAEIDRDANSRDNAAWAVLEVRDRLRVAVLGTRRFGSRPPLSEFTPSDWLRLALEPGSTVNGRRDGAQIEVEVLEAARFEAGDLAAFDAVVVAEPGRVRAPGWERLGAYREQGGAIILTASPKTGAQLWVDEAISALDLGWKIEREPIVIEEGNRGLTTPAIDGSDLLWYLRSEVDDLAETVSIVRTLEVNVGETGDVLLATSGKKPVLVATPAETGGGLVVFMASAIDLEWNDLPARPLMVPLFQELLRSSVGRGSSRHVFTAGTRVLVPVGGVEVVQRSSPELRAIPVDLSTGQTRSALRLGGVYEVRNARGVDIGAVTLQPDARAGLVGTVGRERVAAWLAAAVGGGESFAWRDALPTHGGDPSARGMADTPGPGLLLFLIALFLACTELWLARRVSHAVRTGVARQDASKTGRRVPA